MSAPGGVQPAGYAATAAGRVRGAFASLGQLWPGGLR